MPRTGILPTTCVVLWAILVKKKKLENHPNAIGVFLRNCSLNQVLDNSRTNIKRKITHPNTNESVRKKIHQNYNLWKG
jgi:hypothetical protein